jgi:hypothetical protein
MRYFEFKEADITQVKQDIQNLPDDAPSRIVDKIANLIQLAMKGQDEKGRDMSSYSDIASPLSKIDDVDVRGQYKVMAKFMLGNDLSFTEIKKIISNLESDTLINKKQLRAVSSDISKIIPFYKTSTEVAHYFDDMLMYQPGQRIGPGEILFSAHSKDLTKGKKGDLTVISSGQEIEVKGGKTGGRFSDDDVKNNSTAYLNNVQTYLKKWGPIFGKPGKSGYSMAHVVGAIKHNPDKAEEIIKDTSDTIGSLFGESEHIQSIEQELRNGNAEQALYYHGLANLHIYFGAKVSGMGILFIDAGKQPAETNYADNLPELLKVCQVIVKSAYPITTRIGEAFPKITAIVK